MNSQAKTENEPYTPTESEVERAYALAPVNLATGGEPNPNPEHARAQFRRWLAQHDTEVLAAARSRLEAESREALAREIAHVISPAIGRIRLNDAEGIPHDDQSYMRGKWFEAADALIANGAVTLATPAETDEVAAEVAQQGLPEGTTLAALIEHHRAQAATAAAFDALAPVASQGDTPADEASERAGFDWGEWDGIDGPVLLCGVHGYPAQGEVYDRLPSQVGAACQAVDQPPAVPVDSEHEKRVSSIHSAREAVRAIRDVPVDALGFPTEVGATFTALRIDQPSPRLTFTVSAPGEFMAFGEFMWGPEELDPASIEDVRRADEGSGK